MSGVMIVGFFLLSRPLSSHRHDDAWPADRFSTGLYLQHPRGSLHFRRHKCNQTQPDAEAQPEPSPA